MTPLDKALNILKDDPENIENRHHFYSLFLQTSFFIPTFNEKSGDVTKTEDEELQPEKAMPLIMESDGSDFMMLFDHEDRVVAWAEEGVQCITLPGYAIIAMTTDQLHLAMNIGTDYSKQFVPEEISWLKDVVKLSGEGGAGKE
ncbi:MAG: SseB family protein [Desulfuromonadales bacterium]|nr:SseB family protein [Desulfuromonadales bacterium]